MALAAPDDAAAGVRRSLAPADAVPSGVRELPDSITNDRRGSNVRWSRQEEFFTSGKYPMLSWSLYECDPKGVDPNRAPVPEDFFRSIRDLGSGTFGKVTLVETLHTGEMLAMKVMDKQQSSKSLRDKELRAHIAVGACPYIVRYHSCFQTEKNCYILLQYHRGGSLAKFMDEHGVFDVPTSRFYVAEVCAGLFHLHNRGIIHRDIKLTNILLGVDNHVRICDLGLAKLGMTGNRKTHTRCGALRYCAPEVLRREPYGKEVDWWSIGIVLYRMLVGKYPFEANQRDYIKFKIQNEEPEYKEIKDKLAQNVIQCFLKKDGAQRLGFTDDEEEEICTHPFFKAIDWGLIRRRTSAPPIIRRRSKRGESSTGEERASGPLLKVKKRGPKSPRDSSPRGSDMPAPRGSDMHAPLNALTAARENECVRDSESAEQTFLADRTVWRIVIAAGAATVVMAVLVLGKLVMGGYFLA